MPKVITEFRPLVDLRTRAELTPEKAAARISKILGRPFSRDYLYVLERRGFTKHEYVRAFSLAYGCDEVEVFHAAKAAA